MVNYNNKAAFTLPMLVGIALIVIGLMIPVPGGALTTYGSSDGKPASGYYVFDDTYSAIDEYVGGDAYNYIIGASLVGSKIAGTMAMKAIFIVGGAICFSFGVAFMALKKDRPETAAAGVPTELPTTQEEEQAAAAEPEADEAPAAEKEEPAQQ